LIICVLADFFASFFRSLAPAIVDYLVLVVFGSAGHCGCQCCSCLLLVVVVVMVALFPVISL